MDYSEGMLRRMRDRLLQYRHEQRANGHRRSWEWIAATMIDEGADDDDAAAVDYSADAEALRRFSIGKQVPKPERLDALRYFLVEQDYLNDDDLVEDIAPSDDLRALYRFFGLSGDRLEAARQRLCGYYAAFRPSGTGAGEIAVLQIDQTDDGYLKVRETVHRTSALPNSTSLSSLGAFLKTHSLSETSFEGWLLENSSGQGIILLKDNYTGKDDHYAVAADQSRSVDDRRRSANLLLLKHTQFGADMRIGGGPAEARVVDAVAALRAALGDHFWHFERHPEV